MNYRMQCLKSNLIMLLFYDSLAKKTNRRGTALFDRCFFFYPAGIYLFKANDRHTRKTCEICSKLAIKTPMASFFIVNFDHILQLALVFLLLTLNM